MQITKTKEPLPKQDIQGVLEQLQNMYYWDPVLFSQVILNVVPDDQQAEILRTVYEGKRTSVRSGRGTGKTWIAAMLVWHFLITRPHSNIYLAGPSSTALSSTLWKSIKAMHNNMNPLFKEMFDVQNNSIKHKEHPLTWFCVVRSARKENPDSMAGAHAEHMLYIIDEASGVDDAILGVISKSLTEEDNRLLLISNPRRVTGYYFETFHDPHKRKIFSLKHMSCHKSAHITAKDLQELIDDCGGEGTDQYMIEVMGEFPLKEERTIIAKENIQRAKEYTLDSIFDQDLTDIPESEIEPIIWGLDMAAGNDRSVLVKRQENKVFDDIKKWKFRDTMKVVAKVKEEYDNTDDKLKPTRINVDSIGVGKGAYDRMRELKLPVIAAIASNKAVHKKYNFNQKAEWWKQASEWFKGDVDIPDDGDLILELSAMHNVPDASGRFKCESKEQYIKRFKHSPDTGDAFAMTFCMKSKIHVSLITL